MKDDLDKFGYGGAHDTMKPGQEPAIVAFQRAAVHTRDRHSRCTVQQDTRHRMDPPRMTPRGARVGLSSKVRSRGTLWHLGWTRTSRV